MKPWWSVVFGIRDQRRFLQFIRGRRASDGAGSGGEARQESKVVAGDGIWGRYLESSQVIVEQWGGKWINVPFLGRPRGVWLLVLLLLAVVALCGLLVVNSLGAAVRAVSGA